jgi:hypothetical protein
LSFFDEADEPPPRPPRTQPRRSRPSGGGGPPRGDQQAIQTRRTVAAVVVVIVIIVLALLIHSCDVSESNTALRDYTNSVAGIIRSSNATGAQVFTDLSGNNKNCSGAANLQTCVSQAAAQSVQQLSRATALSVPGGMQAAQKSLLYALKLRRDAYAVIASQVEPSQASSTAAQAVQQIATGTERVSASDVIYTAYAAQQITQALHAAGIRVGPTGETIVASQILPNLNWLQSAYVAGRLSAKVSSSKVNTSQPGQLRGHLLNSVSYNGSALVQGQTATIASKAGIAFVLNLTNGGNFPEYDVQCTASVAGLNDSANATIAQTLPNQSYNCTVTLPTAPTPGTYNVKFGVTAVPGEKNTANNYIEIPIDFTSG